MYICLFIIVFFKIVLDIWRDSLNGEVVEIFGTSFSCRHHLVAVVAESQLFPSLRNFLYNYSFSEFFCSILKFLQSFS